MFEKIKREFSLELFGSANINDPYEMYGGMGRMREL